MSYYPPPPQGQGPPVGFYPPPGQPGYPPTNQPGYPPTNQPGYPPPNQSYGYPPPGQYPPPGAPPSGPYAPVYGQQPPPGKDSCKYYLILHQLTCLLIKHKKKICKQKVRALIFFSNIFFKAPYVPFCKDKLFLPLVVSQ